MQTGNPIYAYSIIAWNRVVARIPTAASGGTTSLPTRVWNGTAMDQRLWYRPTDGDSDGVDEQDIRAVEYEL